MPRQTQRILSLLLLLTLSLSCSRSEPTGVIDDSGREVRITGPVRRVVSLAPNVTEIIHCLGAESLLAGRDDFSNYPPRVRALPSVGGVTPSVEGIASLRPDLVVASAAADQRRLATALSSVGIPIYFVRADRLRDIDAAAQRLGAVLRAPQTDQCSASIRTAIGQDAPAPIGGPRVLYVVWPQPLYVAGRDTFVGDIIERAGGRNAVTVAGWPQYSLEALVANPPDIVLVPDKSVGKSRADAFFRQNEPWGRLEAVRSGRVFVVDEDRFTRAGPRVGEAISELEALIEQCCRH